jgi:hypothetical protein
MSIMSEIQEFVAEEYEITGVAPKQILVSPSKYRELYDYLLGINEESDYSTAPTEEHNAMTINTSVGPIQIKLDTTDHQH